MPARLLYENITTSKKINMLSDAEEVFYYRLNVCCDDFGCFFGEPDVLKSKLYPRKLDKTEDEILSYRDRIVAVGLAFLYEENGETYIFVTQWERFQRVRNQRRKFPAPPTEYMLSGETATTCSNLQQLAATCNNLQLTAASRGELQPSCARAESNPNPIQSESESESNPTWTKKDVDEFFEKAWSMYPKKLGKGKVSYATKKRSFALGEEFLRCIGRYIEGCTGKDEKYIMHGSTFFNSGYVDFLDKNYTPTNKQGGGKNNGRNKGINPNSLKGFKPIE